MAEVKHLQRLTHRCDSCGLDAPVVQQSPYEFTWTCQNQHSGILSWAHAAEPPEVEVPVRTLFDVVEPDKAVA